jgi:two-component system OmpR family response regulator
MKILLVEDNTSITKALSKFFNFKGFDCTAINDGRNGLEMIRNGSYDVVLLDLAMPDFTGYDVIEALVKENKVKDQRIIVLTASSLSDDKYKKLRATGIHSVQNKPMDVNTLIEVMR